MKPETLTNIIKQNILATPQGPSRLSTRKGSPEATSATTKTTKTQNVPCLSPLFLYRKKRAPTVYGAEANKQFARD